MVIFGKLKDIKKQISGFKYSEEILKYLLGLNYKEVLFRLKSSGEIKPFKVDIIKDKIFSVENSYNSFSREGMKYESHEKYIDIQYILSGKEIVEVENTDKLSLISPYNDENDVALYDNKDKGSILILESGMVAIFFPEDAHMPGLKFGESEEIVKAVVKYSINLL